MKIRIPDLAAIYTADGIQKFCPSCSAADKDVSLSFQLHEADGALLLSVKADETPLTYLRLRWNFTAEEKRTDCVKILGDHYERGYGDLCWRGIEPGRMMPWYLLVSNGSDKNPDVAGRFTEGFGVKVQPSAIVTWQYDEAGLTLWADIRNGGEGVILGGRTLPVCTVLFGEYRDCSAFEAGRAFCRAMCPHTVLPKHKVYGSNNWYYAYGHSSHEEILGDTKIVAEQSAGLDNLPYMVIDDGWQKWNTDAPWTIGNERFPDMKRLAEQIREMGVRPGIWTRYLVDSRREIPEATDEWRLSRDANYLDPSHPDVIAYVKRITKMFVEDWGYELIKHDYSTFDLFGAWGFQMGNQMTRNGWHFYDRSRTSAEIVKDFYAAVREAAGENCVIIGCNTIGHLCADLYELNRTGDDTSGREWDITRRKGVNTLAFRMIQNGIFYMTDADCVGITGRVPWEKNRLWMDVLARSGSPLFVSCKPGVLNDAEYAELKEAWATNSIQANDCRPLDWMENETPADWLIDGKVVHYDWFGDMGAETFRP